MVTSEGLNLRLVVLHKNQELVLYKSTKCWVLPVKTYLTAPYLVKGVSKKLNFGFTFDLSHSLVYGGQKQNWIINKNRIALLKKQIFQKLFLKKAYICPDFFAYRVKGFLKGGDVHRKKLQLNSCQARINRHDLYGASAAERLTAQRRAGLPVRKVRFGSVDNKYSLMSRF